MVILRLKQLCDHFFQWKSHTFITWNAAVAKYLTSPKKKFDLTFIFPVVASCAGSKHSWHFMKTSWYLFHFLKNLHVKEIFFCHFLFDIVILLSQEQSLIPCKAHCKLWWLEKTPPLWEKTQHKISIPAKRTDTCPVSADISIISLLRTPSNLRLVAQNFLAVSSRTCNVFSVLLLFLWYSIVKL